MKWGEYKAHTPCPAFRHPSTVQASLSGTCPQPKPCFPAPFHSPRPAFRHPSTVQTPLSDTLPLSRPRFPTPSHGPDPAFRHPSTVQTLLSGTLPQSRHHFLTLFSHAKPHLPAPFSWAKSRFPASFLHTGEGCRKPTLGVCARLRRLALTYQRKANSFIAENLHSDRSDLC